MPALLAGGSSGLGLETCRALTAAGAHVLLACRNLQAGKNAAAVICQPSAQGEAVPGSVEVLQLELASLASVQGLVQHLLEAGPLPSTIICNAGIMATPYSTTSDGYELQWQVNYLGHFALVTGLLPALLKQGKPVRIINVSSVAQQHLANLSGGLQLDDTNWRRRYYGWGYAAYGHSKLAQVLFAKELARRYADADIAAFSLHPGNILTNIQRTQPVIRTACHSIKWLIAPALKTPEQGAATSVWAAVAPELPQHNGAYLQDCHIDRPNPKANDVQLAKDLWDFSAQQVAAASKRREGAG